MGCCLAYRASSRRFDGNLKYNMSVGQIAALAYYALSVDPDTIQMYSMTRIVCNRNHQCASFYYPLAFTFTNQSNRVDIIDEVYGIKAKKRSSYTLNSLRLLWGQVGGQTVYEGCRTGTGRGKGNAGCRRPAASEEPMPTPTPTPEPSATPAPRLRPIHRRQVSGGNSATPTPTAIRAAFTDADGQCDRIPAVWR